jgi:hypothetical protein
MYTQEAQGRLMVFFIGPLFHVDNGNGVDVHFAKAANHDLFLAVDEYTVHRISQTEQFVLTCPDQTPKDRLRSSILPILPFAETTNMDDRYKFARLQVPQPRKVHEVGNVIDGDDLFEDDHAHHVPRPRRYRATHAFEYIIDSPADVRLTGDWTWEPSAYPSDQTLVLYVVGRPPSHPHKASATFNEMMRLVPDCKLRMKEGKPLLTPEGKPAHVETAGIVPLYTGAECIGAGTVAP